jgi:hypothetical protein
MQSLIAGQIREVGENPHFSREERARNEPWVK